MFAGCPSIHNIKLMKNKPAKKRISNSEEPKAGELNRSLTHIGQQILETELLVYLYHVTRSASHTKVIHCYQRKQRKARILTDDSLANPACAHGNNDILYDIDFLRFLAVYRDTGIPIRTEIINVQNLLSISKRTAMSSSA
jgi:hypothetical protein